MRASWSRLPAWPYPEQPQKPSAFQVGWAKTLDDLGLEVERVHGSDLVIGIVADDSQFSTSGQFRADGKFRHRGAEVSFDAPDRGRLVFHTDVFPYLVSNLRAICLGLAALRAVDRYGITTGAEQYAGFAQIGTGPIETGPDPERGKTLVIEAGSIPLALKRFHPDAGGSARDFADVIAYKTEVRA